MDDLGDEGAPHLVDEAPRSAGRLDGVGKKRHNLESGLWKARADRPGSRGGRPDQRPPTEGDTRSLMDPRGELATEKGQQKGPRLNASEQVGSDRPTCPQHLVYASPRRTSAELRSGEAAAEGAHAGS